MMRTVIAVLLAVAVATAHTVVKRQIDTGVDGVVENLAAAVDALQAQVTELTDRLNAQSEGGMAPSGSNIAFFAQYANDHATGQVSGAYVFDQVILNNGNAYDPSTGVFTAPVTGVYLIGVQLFTDGGETEHPFVDIKINSMTAARMAFDEATGQEDSDATMIIWQLQAGDQVYIASEEGMDYHYWGMYHTFFTGTLLAATPGGSGVVIPSSPSIN